jgi:hypothetical protein
MLLTLSVNNQYVNYFLRIDYLNCEGLQKKIYGIQVVYT